MAVSWPRRYRQDSFKEERAVVAFWQKRSRGTPPAPEPLSTPTYGLLPHHGSPEERSALGKRIRSAVGRRELAKLPPRLSGAKDPVAILQAQALQRVPELIGLRYFRMLESPFAYLRGSAAVMAADFGPLPRTGLEVQLCGDAHLANFGVFYSPERRLVFDLNDFDETQRGSFEWDVKRLVISGAVAAIDLGFSEIQAERAARTAAEYYRKTMRELANKGNLDVFYAHGQVEEIRDLIADEVGEKVARGIDTLSARARRKDALRAFDRLTETLDGVTRFVSDPPVLVPLRELTGEDQGTLRSRIEQMVGQYRESLPVDRRALLEQYEVIDVARKVVGVGSVGTRCYVVLLEGRDANDPLFLQIKEAEPSVLEPYFGASKYEQHGERVVEGQRAIQATPDPFLGWHRFVDFSDHPTDVYVRQLWDAKASVNLTKLDSPHLLSYMAVCGQTLARAHARTGDRIAIAAYLGSSDSFERAMGAMAMDGVQRNLEDFNRLVAAAEDGLIPVTIEH